MRMTNNSILPIVMVGLGIIAITTAPIWLPHLLGIKPRGGECGVQITSNGFHLYCSNQY